MLIHLDTSFLIDALVGPRRKGKQLRTWFERGEIVTLSSPVLYEWLRGPRTPEEMEDQERLFPVADTVPVDGAVSALAARLYRAVRSPRGREIDLLIAACAIEHGAALATLNPRDFDDVPGLDLAG